MAEPKPPAVEAASVPDPTLVSRAEAFTRERFVHEGEDTAVALAPGSGRRRALDAALAELGRGAKVPSTKWRRRYALLLGLERLLSQDQPALADGTTLNPHQVDALSGTLTALLAAAQNGTAHAAAAAARTAAPVLAVDEGPDDEPEDEEADDLDLDLEPDLDDESGDGDEAGTARAGDGASVPAAFDEDDEDAADVDEDVAEGAAEDPN